MGDVTSIRPGVFDPDRVNSEEVIAPDEVLEATKGKCSQLVLVFLDPAGDVRVAGSHSAPESHMLLAFGMAELLKLSQG